MYDRRRPVFFRQRKPGAELGSIALQHDNVDGSPAGKQCPDQLRGQGLVALRTLIPLQAVGERMCVGDREGARRCR
jgi:hypothetical protein